ncbi:MAG TPA: M4 family metallopeptidase [Thermoanaerobaculia bacterium]|nr:M4 family metallopeptidase [Thermoanaerobaculia bacterium]
MPPKKGLRSFAFHRDESAASPALAAALAARPAAALPGERLATMEPERAARILLQNALDSDGLPGFTSPEVDAGAAEFKLAGHRKLLLTNSQTVKFLQFYRDVPVYGSLITVEMDARNRLLSINSALGAPAGVDALADVSPADALATVSRAAGYGTELPDVQPQLSFYFEGGAGTWHLAYIAENVPQRQGGAADDDHHLPQVFDYVVDANTGDLIAALPRTQTAEPLESEALDGLAVMRKFRCSDVPGKGKCLADPHSGVQTHDFAFNSVEMDQALLPGEPVLLKDPDSWDPAAVSAHANAAEVADFLERVLMRKGIDGEGGPLISSINCVRRLGAQEWRNAAWISTQMVYGQRLLDGKLLSYAVSRDVVAHEIFHGVTEHSARLDYLAESGALNESYSDIFGILISNWRQSDLEKWNWQIGEELDGTGLPLRDLSDPEKCKQPAHMKDYQDLPVTQAGDWGGVHVNSGIHNKAAYNLLTAKPDGNYAFDPATVARLFYLTLTEQLSRTSGFSDSRRGLELVARSLFRTDPDRNVRLAAIIQAFEDVGIER